MFRLKSIDRVINKVTCACGNVLKGGMCSKHGPEIPIAMTTVTVTLEVVTTIEGHEEPLHFQVTFPENELLRRVKHDRPWMIPQREFMRHHVTFEFTVASRSSHGDEPLLESFHEFLDHIDAHVFFGVPTLKSYQFKRSGTRVFFQCVPMTRNEDHLQLAFMMLVLRNLKSYIRWRQVRFKSTRESITKSLTSTRRGVFTREGRTVIIADVQWFEGKDQPVIIDVEGNLHQPEHLYQGHHHFLIDNVARSSISVALHALAINVAGAFQRYLAGREVKVRWREIKDQRRHLARLVGGDLAPTASMLRAAGNIQNQRILKENKLNLMNIPIQQARVILIIACSATKSLTPGSLPAVLRYCGTTFLLLKSLLLSNQWPHYTKLVIISAKHGLLDGLDAIPWYDQRLTRWNVRTLQHVISRQLRDVSYHSDITQAVLVNMPPLYLKAAQPLQNYSQKAPSFRAGMNGGLPR